MDVTEIDIVFQFRNAMIAAGLSHSDEIVADGSLHRLKVNGDRNPNGWYVLHSNGIPAGIFGNWKTGLSETWCAKGTAELTQEERADRDRKWAAAKAQRQIEERRQQEQARIQGEAILAAAQPAFDDHPYLTRKGIKACSGVMVGNWPQRQQDNVLLIPLRSAVGQLLTLQGISATTFRFKDGSERNKDFLRGGKKSAAFFVCGDLTTGDFILIAEGYATAATLHGATGCPAVMAVDAGNLKPVAEALRALYPDRRIIICADNDRTTSGNPGVTKARAAAKAIKADLAIPEFPEEEAGTDFNDLAALQGLSAVSRVLAAAQPVQAAKATEPASSTHRPVILQIIPGEMAEMTDDAELALCKHDANLYQRSGQLVRWTVSRPETVHGIARPGGTVILLPLDADYLLDRLNRLIRWERWSDRREGFVPSNAPRPVATALLARRGVWKTQPLVAAINAPTLRPDGSILEQPGYDAATGLLLVDHGIPFDPVPPNPTCAQAAAALRWIDEELLSGFPFAQASDRAAALSAILTACIRHALKNAPMCIFSAPRMASGKSLLADVVSLFATGRPATVMSFTSDPEEMRKRVLTVLLSGDAVINIDNIEEPLQSQTLCSVLTQESFTDRILGTQRSATAPTSCLWLGTGNNLTVAGDLSTRIVPCHLDPQCERPEEREFERNLYQWIPANRPRLVTAALTVLRAYVVAGRPKQPIKNFARFEDWSGWVRSALVWLGETDPLLGRERMEDNDPVREKLRGLILGWFSAFRTAPATSKEAVLRANETFLDDDRIEQPRYPALREALEEHFKDSRSGALSSRYVGEFLKKYARRIEQGARFEDTGSYGTRALWRIKVVDPVAFESACNKFSGEGKPTALTASTAKPPHPSSTPNTSGAPLKSDLECRNPPSASDENFAVVQSVQSLEPRPEKFCAETVSDWSPDAVALWEVLKRYSGAERIEVLARKAGGWPQSRVIFAVQELEKRGLARQTSDLVAPILPEVR